jgi:uncharacterized Zn-binding protein involved in type VI secretion
MSLRAAGRIGDQYINRCSTPMQGTGAPTVYMGQLASSRIGDKTIPYQEIVPCPKCCKTHTATVLSGSPKVFAQGLAVEAIGDKALGISGSFPLLKGAPTVFVT